METKANYVLLGASTVIAVGLAFLFALWIARASFSREFATYDVVFEGAARGIGSGTEVRFNGIRVGEIKRLFMDPQEENRVVARIGIEATWPVRADSEARLEPIGLTGVNLIQISAGTPTSPLLRQRLGEGPPRIFARQGAIDELLASSEDIAENATEALAGARDMLSRENVQRVERILDSLEKVSRTLAAERGLINNASGAAAQLRDSSRQFGDAAREIGLLAGDARGSLARVETRAGALFDSSQRALDGIGGAAESVDSAASSAAVNALPELASAAADLRRLSETLERVAADVERSPTFSAVGGQKPRVKVAP